MLALHTALLLMVGAVATSQARDALSEAAEFPEVVIQARDYGIDYPKVVRRATRGNVAALIKLFNFTRHTDGAGAESHCSVLRLLMERLGDRHFSSVLRHQSGEVRTQVTKAIDFDFGRSWQKAFPLTYSLGLHET